jgi:predicted  nucleic acid-binding Zn-ribbon protein
MSEQFDALIELRGKGANVTKLEEALVALWQEIDGLETLAADAATELATLREAVEAARVALQAVVHDRPSAHTDQVWQMANAALATLERITK